jgi:hypothetical protein
MGSSDFPEGHPCVGKDCLTCETCIFDRELFPNKETPNEREKRKQLNNMCNNKTCNECVNLVRDYTYCGAGRFDAACKVVSYEAFGEKRPRRIDYNLALNQSIARPNWCPLISGGSTQLALPSQVSHKPNPQSSYLTYSDRREMMKNLKCHVAWDDIQEGKIYVIPRILSQARKIVKVITKTNLSCICHEISEYTGNEYNYNSTFYPSDLDAVFITEIRDF